MLNAKRLGILIIPACALTAGNPSTKVVKLDTQGKGHLAILSDMPETATMRSGLVVLEMGKSAGKHRKA